MTFAANPNQFNGDGGNSNAFSRFWNQNQGYRRASADAFSRHGSLRSALLPRKTSALPADDR
jgi:hypothetical protein